MFNNVTFDDWKKIKAAKVDAAWHLHELLPKLDFFVSLSSITAVTGHVGQSIYSATSVCIFVLQRKNPGANISLQAFLDAFSEYRLKQGLPAVSISLPVVEGIGFVATRGMAKQLESSIGATLTEDEVYTLIKGAIIGPSSGLNVDGKSFSFKPTPPASDGTSLPWECFSSLASMRRKSRLNNVSAPRIATGSSYSLQEVDDPAVLMQALQDKVSIITMTYRDEITPHRRLLDYGLDSLVSVELRNWIRWELGCELGLKDIVSASTLEDLLELVLCQRKQSH